MTSTIGFIGLGAMGMPMARHLAASGFAVQGYDPLAPDANDRIVRAPSAAAAAAGAAIVVLMVATPSQAVAALGGHDGVLAALEPGSTVIIMSTIGPDAVIALEAEIAMTGGFTVDAPVSGGTARAAEGKLTIMVSAATAAIDRVRPLLDNLGGNVFVLGDDVGIAQRMKLVNQLLCGVHIAAAGEALAYAGALGIAPATAFEVLSTGAASSFMLDDRGPRMIAESFAESKSAVDIFIKDLRLVIAASSFPLPIAGSALSRFELAFQAGKGLLDDSAVITTYLSKK